MCLGVSLLAFFGAARAAEPPKPSTDPEAVAATARETKLTWKAGDDTMGFAVERRVQGGGGRWKRVQRAKAGSATDAGSDPFTAYDYRVRAVREMRVVAYEAMASLGG
jgi:hypothetical protein